MNNSKELTNNFELEIDQGIRKEGVPDLLNAFNAVATLNAQVESQHPNQEQGHAHANHVISAVLAMIGGMSTAAPVPAVQQQQQIPFGQRSIHLPSSPDVGLQSSKQVPKERSAVSLINWSQINQ